MKEYKKTYLPLILWCIALVPVMTGAVLAAECFDMGSGVAIAWMMAAVIVMLAALFGMIWKGGYVYWISGGPSFEEAKAADSAVRREYAWKHLIAVLKGSAAALVLLAVEYLIGAHEIVMVLSVGVCIIATAISTLGIRWAVNEDDSKN